MATWYSKYGHAIASYNPVDGTVYRQVTAVDARGNPTAAILGGASVSDTTGLLQDTRTYRPSTGEVLSIAYTKGAAALRRLDYRSDVYGNLTRQQLNAGATTETYAYDGLMRMTQASRSGAANATTSYQYDAAGNFTAKSDFSTPAANAYSYTGGSCGGGPDAVKSIQIASGGTRRYCYDADGNLTADSAGLAVKYDHDNLPVVTARGGQTIWLAYGPDHQHTREWGSGDGTKVYLDGGYEDWISQGTSKVYVGTEAEITNGSTGRKVNYLLTDRLGSVDSIADSTGALVETRGSDAFGKPRSGTWADLSPAQLQSTAITARGFTEHEHLNAVQLIHMNGRVYDYQIGRFLSVDPFIQFPLNSQSLNPYSYILNNPLAGTDPTGYCEASVGTHICDVTAVGTEMTASDFKTLSATTNGSAQSTKDNGNRTIPIRETGSPGDPGTRHVSQTTDANGNHVYGDGNAPDNGAQRQAYTGPKLPIDPITYQTPQQAAAWGQSNPSTGCEDCQERDNYDRNMQRPLDKGRFVTQQSMKWLYHLVEASSYFLGPVGEERAGAEVGTAAIRSATDAGKDSKVTSQIDRAAFAKERTAYWKSEAAAHPGNYTPTDLARMERGRAPIGSDGYPMELHHIDRTPEGGVTPMTRTDHRLGDNYKLNHPDN